MPYELCRHIKTNGQRCHSPAASGENWCFFHTRLYFRHRAIRSAKAKIEVNKLYLPPIEDRESIQVAASLVVSALSTGHVDEKRATAILRALQLASRNLDEFPVTQPAADSIVRSYRPTLDGIELAPRRMSDESTPPEPAPAAGRRDNPSSLPLDEYPSC